MLINNGILAFVYRKCLHVEFDNRVGLELQKLQITLERFPTHVICLNLTQNEKTHTTKQKNKIAKTSAFYLTMVFLHLFIGSVYMLNLIIESVWSVGNFKLRSKDSTHSL
jgi:hypothetical protein